MKGGDSENSHEVFFSAEIKYLVKINKDGEFDNTNEFDHFVEKWWMGLIAAMFLFLVTDFSNGFVEDTINNYSTALE